MGHREEDARPSSPGWQNVETPFFKASCLEQGQTQASAEILAALSPWEPRFQGSQLHLWCGSKGLSPEDPKIIRELRAALGLW